MIRKFRIVSQLEISTSTRDMLAAAHAIADRVVDDELNAGFIILRKCSIPMFAADAAAVPATA